MDAVIFEWGSLLLRWLHVTAGIAWIGSSFYFMHLDASLKASPGLPRDKGGETWEVHGGGFYQVKKYLIAPDALPAELIWHKWPSYATWISGFFLLVWVYYLGTQLYLINPAVRDLSPTAAAAVGIGGLCAGWILYDRLCRALGQNDTVLAALGLVLIVAAAWCFQQVFSGRGAFIHTGALMATIMSANVFFVIIPNQKNVVASLRAGLTPNASLGRQAKQRSSHNNYLTLPVLFLMLANHYPLAYSTPFAFVIVGLVAIAGAAIRHFYNVRHASERNIWWAWILAAACILASIVFSMSATPFGRKAIGLAAQTSNEVSVPIASRVPDSVVEIIAARCSMCHAAEPLWPGMAIAPKGVLLDSPDRILGWAKAIHTQAVLSPAMPPNNVTQMTLEDRQALASWIATLSQKSAHALDQ